MSDITGEAREDQEKGEIALEVELDASPEKVWRAISVPAFRQRWLPQADLAGGEPIASVPGVEIRYRMREDRAPFRDSTVTFRIGPAPRGGTLFRVIHRIGSSGSGANDNLRPASLAA